MAIPNIQLHSVKGSPDAHQRDVVSDRRAEMMPTPAIDVMRRQLDSRLYSEFGERRPTDAVLSDAQIQRCAGLFAQIDQDNGRDNLIKDAEKLLFASGYMSLALCAYYGAISIFASGSDGSVALSIDHPESVLIPAALFVTGFHLLNKATLQSFTLKEQAWRECLGKKEAYGRDGGALGQLRFEILKAEIVNAANIAAVLTAPSAPVPVIHRAKPRPEFSIRIPIPTGKPSNAIVLTGAAAMAAIGVAILLSPIGV